MNQIKRKILSILLAVVIILGMMPQAGLVKTVHAAAEAVSHDAEEIRDLLESEGDYIIKLDGDAVCREDSMGIWCHVGSGTKIIDLAGYDLEVKDESKGGHSLLLYVGPGATLVVNDSSGKNKGRLICNGYFHKAVRGAAGTHEIGYWNDDVPYRNVIRVDGGNLVFNGGTIKGGRRKPQYVGYGVSDKHNILGIISDHSLGVPTGLNIRYDGDVDRIINCTGIDVRSGNVRINGGVIQGRGFSDFRMIQEDVHGKDDYGDLYILDDETAALKVTGGTVVINDGEFEGLSCAHAIKNSGGDITIRKGVFATYENDKILAPGIETLFDGIRAKLWCPPIYIYGYYGTVGVSDDYVDTERADINKEEHRVEVVPKVDLDFDLYNNATGEAISDHIVWDPEAGDIVLTADTDESYWPYEEIPYSKERPMAHYLEAVAQSSEELGTTSGISFGGMTVSEKGEQVEIKKSLSTWQIYDPETGKLTVKLSDLKPSDVTYGDSFLVSVKYSEVLNFTAKDPSFALSHQTSFVVTLKQNDLAITRQPEGKSVTEPGTSVTLSAQAENASSAFWMMERPDGYQETLEGSFDPATGEATLDVTVIDYAQYSCVFANTMGVLQTNTAAVSIVPAAAPGREVQWSRNSSVVYLNAGTGVKTSGEIGQRWYYRASESDEWTLVNNSRMDTTTYSDTLAVISPADEDAGYYYMERDYDTGDGTATVSSGVFHVTVVDGFTDKTVVTYSSTPLVIYGMPEGMCVGDDAPSNETMASILWTDDDRVLVTQFQWNPEDLTDGKFNTSAPRFNLTIAARVSQGCKLYCDPWGKFFVRIDGSDKTYVGVSPTIKDATTEGMLIDQNLIQGIAAGAGTANWSIETVADDVNLPDKYTLKEGDDVDIQLNAEIICHRRHKSAGNTHDTIAEYYLQGDPDEYHLPAGLSMNTSGHITGTLTEKASSDPVIARIGTKIQGNEEEFHSNPVRFYITTDMSGSGEIISQHLSMKSIAPLSHVHEYGDWVDDGNGHTHTHTCVSCGSAATQFHVWDDGVVTTPATGTTPGVMTYTCQDCGATKTEEIEPHTIVKVEEIPATCTKEGTKEHYECEDCGAAFEDAEGTKPIEDSSSLILPVDENAHDWGEWEVTKKATETEEGEMVRTCKSDPSHTEKKIIPMIGKELAKYTISYDLNGGTLDGKTGTVTLEIEEGTTIRLPSPTREGYAFDYWKGSKYEAGASYKVEGDHTFTAQWKKNEDSTESTDSRPESTDSRPESTDSKPEQPDSKPELPDGKKTDGKKTDGKLLYKAQPVEKETSAVSSGTAGTGKNTASSPAGKGTAADTGDHSNVWLWAVLMLVALSGGVFIYRRKTER